MANIQVLRFQTKSELQAQLVNHVAGETRDETAMPEAPPPVDEGIGLGPIVHLAGVGMKEARRRLEAARPTGRGRRPKDALDLVIAGPPPYYIKQKNENGEIEVIPNPDRWTEERELEWARKVRDWVRELFGTKSVIVTLDLHRDETSPHVQGLVIPIDNNGRLGWCKVRDAASQRFRDPVRKAQKEAVRKAREQREDGKEVADPPPLSIKSRYGVLQDSLYYRVSRGYELERGEVGSKATHEQIDRTKAAERRRGLAQAREREATREAISQRQQADSARERRKANDEETQRQLEAQKTVSTEVHQLREDAVRLRDELEAGQRGALGGRAQKGRDLIKERDVAKEAGAAAVPRAEEAERARAGEREAHSATRKQFEDMKEELSTFKKAWRSASEQVTKLMTELNKLRQEWTRKEREHQAALAAARAEGHAAAVREMSAGRGGDRGVGL